MLELGEGPGAEGVEGFPEGGRAFGVVFVGMAIRRSEWTCPVHDGVPQCCGGDAAGFMGVAFCERERGC